MEPNGLTKWIHQAGFNDAEFYYNVILAGGHVLHNMTAEGVARLVAAGEALEMVIARRWDAPTNQRPAGVFTP